MCRPTSDNGFCSFNVNKLYSNNCTFKKHMGLNCNKLEPLSFHLQLSAWSANWLRFPDVSGVQGSEGRAWVQLLRWCWRVFGGQLRRPGPPHGSDFPPMTSAADPSWPIMTKSRVKRRVSKGTVATRGRGAGDVVEKARWKDEQC